jgi:hypothetical protein
MVIVPYAKTTALVSTGASEALVGLELNMCV